MSALTTRSCPAIYATARRSPVTLASPVHRTKAVGAWIEKEFGLVYESRSGLIALLSQALEGLDKAIDDLEDEITR